MLDMNRGEIAATIADSPVVTKAAFALGGASFAGGWAEYMPLYISMMGGIIAGVAGVFLAKRHWSRHKLNLLQAEKTQLEIDQLKRALLDVG